MKVYLEASNLIKSALAENIKDIEFTDKSEADTIINQIPTTPFKIQDLINLVNNPSKRALSIGNIEISIDKKSATYKNKEISLTEKEISLLESLSESRAELTKEEILEEVWEYSADTNTRTVETHLHRLNNKFQEDFGFKIIESTNDGYKISDI